MLKRMRKCDSEDFLKCVDLLVEAEEKKVKEISQNK
jgi:hypothetical protein